MDYFKGEGYGGGDSFFIYNYVQKKLTILGLLSSEKASLQDPPLVGIWELGLSEASASHDGMAPLLDCTNIFLLFSR